MTHCDLSCHELTVFKIMQINGTFFRGINLLSIAMPNHNCEFTSVKSTLTSVKSKGTAGIVFSEEARKLYFWYTFWLIQRYMASKD